MNNLIKQIVESKFNFNIDDIEGNEKQASLSKSSFNSKSQKLAYKEYMCVDLGLPSKTLWCKYNLGVDPNKLNTPEDWYGNYYAWGEIASKQDYSWKTYAYGSDLNKLTKYCSINKSEYWSGYGEPDGLKVLTLEDDATRQNFGGVWRMPSSELLKELYECTNNEWTHDYNGSDVAGQVFRGNNQELFIPAAGYYNGSDLYGGGSLAFVWSLNLYLDNPNSAYYLYFSNITIYLGSSSRFYGYSVRPVLLDK